MGIGLATLPADRFVGLGPEDPAREGVLETHPLTFEGTELLVNAEKPGDGLRIELVDGTGNVLPGYARQQCRLMRHDALRWRVVWGAGAVVNSLGDARDSGPFAIRFILQGAELYAFEIVDPGTDEATNE
jgi:hypothetical protein